MDCADAEIVGAFYAQLFGLEITGREGARWLQLRCPHGCVGMNVLAEENYQSGLAGPARSSRTNRERVTLGASLVRCAARPAPAWWRRQAKIMRLEVLVGDLEAAV